MNKSHWFKLLLSIVVVTNTLSAQTRIKTDTLQLDTVATDSTQIIFKSIPYNQK